MLFIETKWTFMILIVISVTASDAAKRQRQGTKKLQFVDWPKMQRSFIAWPASHSIRLRCQATGAKPIKYRWLKDGKKMKPRRLDPYMNDTLWYFKLKDLIPSDNGKYTCIVSNKYGSINHTYTLHVVAKPRSPPILKPHLPRNTSVQLGKQAVMRCIVVVSRTQPDFRWLKWHKTPKSYKKVNLSRHESLFTLISPIQYKTIKHGEHFGVELTIAKVTKKDFGMYTCCASNHIGMRCNSAFLDEINPSSPPILKPNLPRNTSVELGQDAVMRCIVIEKGTQPVFKWHKWHKIPKSYKNKPLDEYDKATALIKPIHYKTIKAGEHLGVKLTVANVTKKDLGMYTCCASNHIGMRCNSAFLIEKIIPTTQRDDPKYDKDIQRDCACRVFTSKMIIIEVLGGVLLFFLGGMTVYIFINFKSGMCTFKK